MTLEKDDPKLTAFALGELSPGERAEVEAALAQDPALLAEVEAIQGLGASLGAALQAEPAPRLAETQRAAIEARASRAPRSSGRAAPAGPGAGKLLWFGAAGTMAAGLLLSASFMTLSATREQVAAAPTPAHGELMFGDAPPPAEMQEAQKRDMSGARPVRPEPPVVLELELADVAETDRNMHGTPLVEDPRLAGRLPVGKAEPRVDVGQGPAPADRLRLDEQARRPQAPTPPAANQGAPAPLQAPMTRVEPAPPPAEPTPTGDHYGKVQENAFLRVAEAPLSTFSIDVDRASYAVVRRWLTQQGTLPPPDAVRIEELINYFPYGDQPPARDDRHPFAVKVDVAGCPWNGQSRLVRVGLKGKVMEASERPPANLVFLVDVSGSMNAQNKLPLLRQALQLLVRNLNGHDRVSMVVYAGASGLALPPTPCDRIDEIMSALERLSAGGSTNGGAGIQLAYKVAQDTFFEGGTNRVILCTDGDFNVGTSSHEALMQLIEQKAKSKVFLTVLGFGMGNLKDHMMEQLADKGNGNYGYVDSLDEAKKLLVDELSGTLVTIAKDVKIQVEWNPAVVKSYRLIGYENRKLRDEDFNDDSKDAGEIGAGHAVTALYEVTTIGGARPGVDPLKYQEPPAGNLTDAARSGEMLTIKLRYKQPEGDVSALLELPVRDEGTSFEQASSDLRFASAVAAFGLILRRSEHKGTASLEQVQQIAAEALGSDPGNHRHEFLELVRRARQLSR